MCVSCSRTHSMVFFLTPRPQWRLCQQSHSCTFTISSFGKCVRGMCGRWITHCFVCSCTSVFCLFMYLLHYMYFFFFSCSRKSPTGQNKWILNHLPPPGPNWFQSHHRKLELPVKSLINNCYVGLFSNHTCDKRCQFLIISLLLSALSLLLIPCSKVWKAILSFNNVTTSQNCRRLICESLQQLWDIFSCVGLSVREVVGSLWHPDTAAWLYFKDLLSAVMIKWFAADTNVQ